MPIGSHLANRKWSYYLENFNSFGVNNHKVHFWSHLKLSSEKRLIDAQHFLYLVSSGLRRHFALDAIIFLANWYWLLDFKWRKTKLFVLITHSKSNLGWNLSAIKPFWNTMRIYTMYHLELLLSVYTCIGAPPSIPSINILKAFKSLI